ncbi:MAG: hypothetical protein GYA02_06820 [Clostridiaceae bacterium]|nr:hypothetical protein [Clostridiaceae bacterium]
MCCAEIKKVKLRRPASSGATVWTTSPLQEANILRVMKARINKRKNEWVNSFYSNIKLIKYKN